jgi:hypothetical protein
VDFLLIALGLTAVALAGMAFGGAIAWRQGNARRRLLERQLLASRREVEHLHRLNTQLGADLVESEARVSMLRIGVG